MEKQKKADGAIVAKKRQHRRIAQLSRVTLTRNVMDKTGGGGLASEAVSAGAEVCSSAERLSSSTMAMWSRARSARESARHLAERTEALTSAKNRLDKQTRLAKAFADHFQVGPDDCVALHGRKKDSPLSGDFFVALERVDRLHDHCKTLVHAGFETAALDIMEKISMHREAAVERLFRFGTIQVVRFLPSEY